MTKVAYPIEIKMVTDSEGKKHLAIVGADGTAYCELTFGHNDAAMREIVADANAANLK